MATSPESWSEGTVRRYLLYSAAAVACIPAGIAYAALATHGLERWWTVLLTLIFGVFLAHLGWRFAVPRIPALLPAADRAVSASSVPQTSFDWVPPGSEGSRAGTIGTGQLILGAGAVLSWLLIGFLLWNVKHYIPM